MGVVWGFGFSFHSSYSLVYQTAVDSSVVLALAFGQRWLAEVVKKHFWRCLFFPSLPLADLVSEL